MRTSLMNQRTANGRRSHDDVLDIWLYTQAIHVGKKELEKGKTSGRFTLQDFDEWAERIGRQRFEYLLRSSLRIIAFVYIQFLKQVARPFFALLCREYGMTPGFEAAAALKYSHYPDPTICFGTSTRSRWKTRSIGCSNVTRTIA